MRAVSDEDVDEALKDANEGSSDGIGEDRAVWIVEASGLEEGGRPLAPEAAVLRAPWATDGGTFAATCREAVRSPSGGRREDDDSEEALAPSRPQADSTLE